MYILTIKGHEQEGAYAVADDDGERSLYLFEEKDDAERYGGLLEAEDYPPMVVVEIPNELAIETCMVYNYKYVIVTVDDLVIPPRDNDSFQKKLTILVSIYVLVCGIRGAFPRIEDSKLCFYNNYISSIFIL